MHRPPALQPQAISQQTCGTLRVSRRVNQARDTGQSTDISGVDRAMHADEVQLLGDPLSMSIIRQSINHGKMQKFRRELSI
jgi:hypothetical protein